MSQINAIRNPDGIWINSQVFREEGNHFMKNGYFCPDPWGSPAWMDYWQEQLRRCKEGYQIGGVRITGHHYFYLNFCQIDVAEQISEKVAKKKTKQPDFWDGDYNYFWSLDIARYGIENIGLSLSEKQKEELNFKFQQREESELQKQKALFESLGLQVKILPDYLSGGYHMIVGKSRRKGYSYKNAAIMTNAYNSERGSLNIVGAYEKKFLYPNGTMGMSSRYLNFLNKHTGWRKNRDGIDKQDHKRASFKEKINGVEIEQGFMSEIMALTFKDNPDAARGKDAFYLLLEEAGAFGTPGLLIDSYKAIEPALRAGSFITGQIIVFGTGGDMESGTADYAEMFYSPQAFNLMPFVNIWDEDSESTSCGFFHPVFWNTEGYYDAQGNSDIKGALEWEQKERNKILKNSSSGNSLLQKHVQEYPTKPEEAFLVVSTNEFPVHELRTQLNKVIKENLQLKKGQPVTLVYETTTEKNPDTGIEETKKRVMAKPDLANELVPVIHYQPKVKDLTGCPIIYEYPISSKPPAGLYKAGYDPYRHDEGTSLGSIIIYKSSNTFSFTHNQIVAEYTARPSTTDDFNRQVEMLAELYNCEVMHENEIPEVKSYFRRRRKLHLLAAQPDGVISKNIKESKVSRVYGIHMNEKLKEAGEKYIKRWLLEERDVDENGDTVLNLEKIYSIGLLEELIQYNRKGNFDRVIALMMVMFQLEEEDIDKTYSENPNYSIGDDLLDLMPNLFSNN